MLLALKHLSPVAFGNLRRISNCDLSVILFALRVNKNDGEVLLFGLSEWNGGARGGSTATEGGVAVRPHR